MPRQTREYCTRIKQQTTAMKLSNSSSQICFALVLTLTIALTNGVSGTDDLLCTNSGSTGYLWCEELGECIAPWETSCPVVGEPFQGPITIECTVEMRCSFSSRDDCTFDMGSYTIAALYFSGMNGTFDMSANCTANCTACTEVDPMVEDDAEPSGNASIAGDDAGPTGNTTSAEFTSPPKTAGTSRLFGGWFNIILCFSVWILQHTFGRL
jgi:hypothetical protein